MAGSLDSTLFKNTIQECMERIFELQSTSIAISENDTSVLDSVSYSKKLHIEYGSDTLELQILFYDYSIDFFSTRCDRSLKSYSACVDLTNIYSNILGIILYYVRFKIQLDYDLFSFDIANDVNPLALTQYNTIINFFTKEHPVVCCIGFTFT